jgi:hypothetical protein
MSIRNLKEALLGKLRGMAAASPTSESPTALYGDTSGSLTDHERGQSQHINVDDQVGGTTAYGDADQIHDHARGGNDYLSGGGGRIFLYGDARLMDDHSRGGSDHLTGDALINNLYGDADSMYGKSHGGNDTLTAIGLYTFLYGDARVMTRGGRQRPDSGGGSQYVLW